jgi:phosphoribosylanthranilate isomerase
MPVKIKICCIASAAEALMAMEAGADALGLVARMPSGPGPIADEQIAAITPVIPSTIASFLLTSEQSAAAIIRHIQRTGANTVQIVDELTEGTYQEIRDALPQLKIVQVIHITGKESIEQAMNVEEHVDFLLLDSGNPKAAVKTLGGTGNTHNWEISRRLVAVVKKPVFLAGGLNAGNIQQAVLTVKPYGVDICNGVRTEGKLDKQKLRAFVEAARSAI